MPASSVIAFDYGEKRVGVAVAELISRLPQPHSIIEVSATLFDDIQALVEGVGAKALVVGLPRNMAGAETAQSADARHFSQELGGRMHLPVYLVDESLTSKQAEAELKERGVLYNKEHLDSLAAVYILEDFLRAHPEVK